MSETYWILTADENTAQLLRVERTASGNAHLAVYDEIHDTWDEHRSGRRSPLIGGNDRMHAFNDHQNEWCRRRFAKEIAVWLERQADERRIERVAVFALPHFLGMLRNSWSPRFAIQVDEHHGDLISLSAGDPACHAVITAMIDGDRHEE